MEQNNTIKIPLDKGQFALVSADQYDLVKDIKWFTRWSLKSRTYYADGNMRDDRLGREGKWRSVRMHRMIKGVLNKPRTVVHHRDGNGLNNTKENLEVMTPRQHNRISRGPKKPLWIPPHLADKGHIPEIRAKASRKKFNPEINTKSQETSTSVVYGRGVRPPVDDKCYYDMKGFPFRRVPGTKLQYALVSAERYQEVMQYKWRANFHFNTKQYSFITLINKKHVYLHRLLINAPPDKMVDHCNGNSLDCRDWNLRLADASENARNRGLRIDNSTGFKGVRPSGKNGWVAKVGHKGKIYCSTVYSTKIGAARAYNAMAVRLHGKFANLNKIN